MTDLSAVKEALEEWELHGKYDWGPDSENPVILADAARAYVRLLSEGQTYETEDCIKEHPGHSSLEVFDLDPGIYLVAPLTEDE